MSATLTSAVVFYLALVAVLALAAAAGAPVQAAARTGDVVGRVCTAVVVVVDVLSLARGHRPADPATHLGLRRGRPRAPVPADLAGSADVVPPGRAVGRRHGGGAGAARPDLGVTV